jgi:hypothetical protein
MRGGLRSSFVQNLKGVMMDIKEIKTKKAALESEILDMLKAFEKESGVFISYTNTKIDRGGYDMPTCGANEPKKKRTPKGLYDFTIDINLNRDEY